MIMLEDDSDYNTYCVVIKNFGTKRSNTMSLGFQTYIEFKGNCVYEC